MVNLPDEEVVDDVAGSVVILGGPIVGEREFPRRHASDYPADIELESAVNLETNDGSGDDIADAVCTERFDVTGHVAPDRESEKASVAVHPPHEEVVNDIADDIMVLGGLAAGEGQLPWFHVPDSPRQPQAKVRRRFEVQRQ